MPKGFTKNIKLPINYLFVLFVSTSFIAACGGGGGGGGGSSSSSSSGLSYSGNTAPADIDDSNAEEIGSAAGESVQQAASSGALPTAVQIEENDMDCLHDLVQETARLASLPTAYDASEICTGGGSATADVSGPGLNGSGRLNTRITYRACTVTSGQSSYTIDGTVLSTHDNIGSQTSGFSITYQNVTVSGLGLGSQRLNYTFSCTNLSVSSSCSRSSVFVSSSGDTHRVSNFNVTGNAATGINGSASFSHYVFGTVSITISGITYGGCGSAPDGGSISFNSTTGSSGTISFAPNCTVMGTWNTGTTSGSF